MRRGAKGFGYLKNNCIFLYVFGWYVFGLLARGSYRLFYRGNRRFPYDPSLNGGAYGPYP
jgi:hypothetical protein